MQFQLPDDLNLLLRKYVLDSSKNSREEATIFILEQFLKEFYKVKLEMKK